MRARSALLLVLLALSACERRDAPEPKAKPAATAEAGATPLRFESKTSAAEVSLTLPAALTRHPRLHRTLYDRETAALRAFAADAERSRAELGTDLPPFSMEVEWRVAGETDKLLSLVREAYAYAGGAHPNTATTSLLFDKAAGKEVELSDLVPGEALARLDRTLCDALKLEKAKRGGVALDGDVWRCPLWKDAQAALAPGPGGRASGLTFLFSPYEVGPYAEGGYEVKLPAAAFRAALTPAYRGEFAS